MASRPYRAYVLSQTTDSFVIVSERDKQLHTIPMVSGCIPEVVEVEYGHVVGIQKPYFDASRLFTACREYCYDKKKNSKASVRRNALLKEKRQKAKAERCELKQKELEEKLAKGVMLCGKHKNATYEDIVLLDTKYCDWILKQENKNDEIVKFKEYLKGHYKKEDGTD